MATAPTVTMPRIKALTTGSAPNFLDIVLNFDAASSALDRQDHWLRQLKLRRGFRMSMYGDDTWLKLFPGSFEQFEGTTSFYVTVITCAKFDVMLKDTTTVDTNVTRNVEPALMRQDWDVLILHYLGVDHIGHLSGPNRYVQLLFTLRASAMMPDKLKEMDVVVETIMQHLTAQDAERQRQGKKPTLFLLCGDHGMNDVSAIMSAKFRLVITADRRMQKRPRPWCSCRLRSDSISSSRFVPFSRWTWCPPFPSSMAFRFRETISEN